VADSIQQQSGWEKMNILKEKNVNFALKKINY